ncbi:MAG: osmoprotectant NAGGN system M42 family peptidase [Alphaproteobacteria bacterium]|nr:osmoprotectant NAGGN system M42 family peptidase [Alphaproteobacteria bacterium]MBU0796705.1 osmoprotectant NAGGN system M42 family peptidase [Alphaproteobacteria bacterium]MBU0888254.1 osmoprotectant NAGGN system M42 family peptidase [Alphaproteobacteria bacterium]MBU1811455.1 osmoprotectant NAGGN system M42 family peptidase [Alphaproteobacteria bacterium]MBU2090465.1 osmoprotectant NAGGN system M42 family peptidase [Alphaproteobacteria bacterium]
MIKPTIDMGYLKGILSELLCIPSPSGFTDQVALFASRELEKLGIDYELTRRGAIRADMRGRQTSPDRAIVSHLDTLGAMVKNLKPNGRLELVMIGHWSARFAEGARVTLFTDEGAYRGTILPLKASGHTFNTEIDKLPIGWDYVELRIDAKSDSREDLEKLGVNIGDYVAIDPQAEFLDSGYIVSRHLDDKAGAAVMLAAAKAMVDNKLELPVDCHLLFTISEEVGSGASAVLHGDVAELVSIDNGTTAPGQNSRETGVTIAMKDQTGPFDYHLTHKLIDLAKDHAIPHQRDVFRYYRCDGAAAVEAGNDIRTALLTFGIDASHGYERIHESALESLAELVALYMQSEPAVKRDAERMGSVKGFPESQGAGVDPALLPQPIGSGQSD